MVNLYSKIVRLPAVKGQGLQMYVSIVFTFVSIIPSVTSPISEDGQGVRQFIFLALTWVCHYKLSEESVGADTIFYYEVMNGNEFVSK